MRNNCAVALPVLALALVLAGSGCSSQTTCSSNQTLCGGECTSLQSDALNCGACGTKCGTGKGCSLGACVACGENGAGCEAAVLAACFNANQVIAFDSSLVEVGAPVATSKGPGSFVSHDGTTYVLDSTGGDVEQVTPPTGTAIASIPGGSYNDLQHIAAYANLLYVSNSAVGSFVAVDPVSKKVVDEVSLSVNNDTPNPLGFDFANKKAYVALAAGVGSSPNGLAVVDLSVAPPWKTKPSVKRIDLSPFAFSTSVNPGVSDVRAAADGVHLYVTMNDLYDASFNPVSGANGKLVVIDSITDSVVGNAAVDLPNCLDAGAMALSGNTLWIACGYTVFNSTFTAVTGVGGALQPVNVSGATPVPGTAIPVANHAVGAVTICGSQGYAGASDSGALFSFDPTSNAAPAVNATACPASSSGFAAVFDVACAL